MTWGRWGSWPVYVGGFIGPFGGAMVSPMLPELRDALDTTLAVVATNMTFYLVPFALCLLWSGTLAEIWGRRRVIVAGYVGYAAASAVCALATSAPLFLAGRAGQGITNAFTTPILMSVLVEITAARRLGRALGLFGSIQAAGLTFAPMIGGACAAWDWRLAFWITLAVSLGLAVVPLPSAGGAAADAPRGAATAAPTTARAPVPPATAADAPSPARAPVPPATAAAGPSPVAAPPSAPAPTLSGADRWRSLRNAQLAFACVVAACNYVSVMGITLLGVLLAADRFHLSPQGRGLVVGCFGVAGLLGGGYVGRLLDRHGPRRFGVGGSLAMVAACLAAAAAPAAGVLFAALALGGLSGLATRVSVNALSVHAVPENRGGAASFMLACQFLGGALSPVLLVPIYHVHPAGGMAAAGAGALLAAGLMLVAPSRWLAQAPSQEARH